MIGQFKGRWLNVVPRLMDWAQHTQRHGPGLVQHEDGRSKTLLRHGRR